MLIKNSEDNIDIIKDFLNRINWQFDVMAQDTLCTQYQGQYDLIKILINSSGDKITMMVNPILEKPKSGWGSGVVRLIENLNKDIKLINLGLDEDRDIYVKVDIAMEFLEYEQFNFVLNSLCQVCEQLLLPILQTDVQDRQAAA